MCGQAAGPRVRERAVELVRQEPLRALAPSAPRQREGRPAQRLARPREGFCQLGLGDPGLGAHLGAGAPDEVHKGKRLARDVVHGRQGGLDVRERLGRVNGPGRALGDGSEGGTLHRARGYP